MRKNIARFILTLLLAVTVCTLFSDSSEARSRRRGPVSSAIPEDSRPMAALPWIVGVAMGVVTTFVALKPAKRTHLD